jgi:Domain of unknown function DUF302
VSVTGCTNETRRLAISVDAAFDDFRDRYERSVPSLDRARLDALVHEGASWETIVRAAAVNAPHDFIRYWTLDMGSLMRLAGDLSRCSSYLMGNHTIAERMYRHNPAIALYAPLRTALYEGADGAAWFTVDQPSTRFRSFGDPAITEVGFELDRKLAALLEYLGAPVPPELTPRATSTRPSASSVDGTLAEN